VYSSRHASLVDLELQQQQWSFEKVEQAASAAREP